MSKDKLKDILYTLTDDILDDEVRLSNEWIEKYCGQYITKAHSAILTWIKEEIEKMKQLHKHDSIPSYTAEVDNGCVICIKNQAITDILKRLED